MAHLILPRHYYGRPIAIKHQRLSRSSSATGRSDTLSWPIRYTFYAFIFSLPFETVDLGIGATLPKLFGVALAAVALLQPHLCYKAPPRAFWCFSVYLCVFVLAGSYMMLDPPDVPEFTAAFIRSGLKLSQLLILFWISYNLMKQEQVFTGTLWILVAATILLSVLQIAGITTDVSAQGRVAALDRNPNGLATILSLGLLALLGLAYSRQELDRRVRILFWLASGPLALAIVQTGSRGAIVALVLSLSVFFLQGRNPVAKLKFGLIAVTGVIILLWASYQIEAVRVRWERVLYDGTLSGREYIYPETIAMILERPFLGWGPVNHLWELGPRVGRQSRDEHNVYFWVLAEVGLIGAIPFLAGVWLCWRAGWRAHKKLHNILPLLMLLFILVTSMKGTLINLKFFWIVLSLALAAGSYVPVSSASKVPVSLTYSQFSVLSRRQKLVKVSARGRASRYRLSR